MPAPAALAATVLAALVLAAFAHGQPPSGAPAAKENEADEAPWIEIHAAAETDDGRKPAQRTLRGTLALSRFVRSGRHTRLLFRTEKATYAVDEDELETLEPFLDVAAEVRGEVTRVRTGRHGTTLWLAVGAIRPRGEGVAALRRRADGLVADLASKRRGERDEARAHLRRLGPYAVPALREAAPRSTAAAALLGELAPERPEKAKEKKESNKRRIVGDPALRPRAPVSAA